MSFEQVAERVVIAAMGVPLDESSPGRSTDADGLCHEELQTEQLRKTGGWFRLT